MESDSPPNFKAWLLGGPKIDDFSVERIHYYPRNDGPRPSPGNEQEDDQRI